MRILHTLCLSGLALALCPGVESTITVGFHNRGPQHWAKYLDAACIGTDGTRNPLGDKTDLLSDTDRRKVTSDKEEDYTQWSAQWDLSGPAMTITVSEWWDVRAAPYGGLKVYLQCKDGSMAGPIRSAADSYQAASPEKAVVSMMAVGKVHCLKPSGNAGGYAVLKATVVEVSLDGSDYLIDGTEDTDYAINVSPADMADNVTVFDIETTTGPEGRDTSNPSGQDLLFAQQASDKAWSLLNARYYNDGTNTCWDRKSSSWQINPLYTFGDSATSTNFKGADFFLTVDVEPFKESEYRLSGWYTGLNSTPVLSQRNDGYEIDFTGFTRQISGAAFLAPELKASSQYYTSIRAEENFHETDQFEAPSHAVVDKYYRISEVINTVTNGFPFPTEQAARDALAAALTAEQNTSNANLGATKPDRIAIEEEAKNHAQAQYPFTLPCTYRAEAAGGGT